MNCGDFDKNQPHCKKTFFRKLRKFDYRWGIRNPVIVVNCFSCDGMPLLLYKKDVHIRSVALKHISRAWPAWLHG